MSNTDIAIAAIRQLYKADEEIEKLKAENAELQAKWDYYQQFCADHGAHGIADLAVQRDALRAQLTTALAALEACDEAMGYMSEYDIPITLPDQVKEAIAAIGGGEWRTTPNPCRKVKKFKIPERETILTPDQIASIERVMDEQVRTHQIPQSLQTLVKLLLLTGCRLNEIMSAEQAWIDHERRLLLLPDSKVGQRKIPLSESAMAVIREVPKGKWLIKGRLTGDHMRSPWKMWHGVTKAAGIPGKVRLHDLRHTVGSLAHRAGLSQLEVAKLLGHKHLVTTQRYLHGLTGDSLRSVEVVASVVTQASSSARSLAE